MTVPLLTYESSARSKTSAIVLAGIYAGLLVLWQTLQLYWVIIAAAVLCTLPAAWEFATAKRAGLRLARDRLHWFSGGHQGDVALDKITQADFDTRLDLSVRVTLIIEGGRKIRLPHDCLPKHPALQEALERCAIKTTRNHFKMF